MKELFRGSTTTIILLVPSPRRTKKGCGDWQGTGESTDDGDENDDFGGMVSKCLTGKQEV